VTAQQTYRVPPFRSEGPPSPLGLQPMVRQAVSVEQQQIINVEYPCATCGKVAVLTGLQGECAACDLARAQALKRWPRR
jgi:hypothetical protein